MMGEEARTNNATHKKPGRNGTAHKFTALRKAAFLECLEKGSGRVKATKTVGICYHTLLSEMELDPAFRDAVDLAEMTLNRIVEEALFTAAKKGNVVACQVWLYNRAPDRWKDKRNVSVEATMNYRNPLEGKTIEELARIADFAARATPEDLAFLSQATEGLADGPGNSAGGNGGNPPKN